MEHLVQQEGGQVSPAPDEPVRGAEDSKSCRQKETGGRGPSDFPDPRPSGSTSCRQGQASLGAEER